MTQYQKIEKARLQTVNLFTMIPGKERRALLLENIRRWGEFGPGLPVNRRYQFNMQDPDLKVLIRKGLVRRVRDGMPRCRQTYLRAV